MEGEGKKRFVRGGVLILVVALSFALGFLYANQTAIAPIIIEKCSDA